MTGAFNNMNKGNVLIYFLYIHLMFYKKKIHDRKPWIKATILSTDKNRRKIFQMTVIDSKPPTN